VVTSVLLSISIAVSLLLMGFTAANNYNKLVALETYYLEEKSVLEFVNALYDLAYYSVSIKPNSSNIIIIKTSLPVSIVYLNTTAIKVSCGPCYRITHVPEGLEFVEFTVMKTRMVLVEIGGGRIKFTPLLS